MKKTVLLIGIFIGFTLAAKAQTQSRIVTYDEEDGLAHGHVTQLLQDELGFIWLATWNGLCRYDGYEFRTFKAQVGDGCNMAIDRFRDISLRPDGKMVCRVDDDYYLFDTHTYRFSNIPAAEVEQAVDDIKNNRRSVAKKSDDGTICFSITDMQGNRWETTGKGVSKETAVVRHTERLTIEPVAEVKCLFTDSHQRYWLTTKDDGAVRVYSLSDDRLLGYLGADGRLHPQYTTFGAAVYCMYEAADGSLWLGCKPGGLFRMKETATGTFKIDHFTDMPHQNVYSICEDRYGRLWVATLGGGVFYTDQPQVAKPRFMAPKGYPKDAGQRVRYLYLAQNGSILMAAATDGLMVAKLEKNADLMRFHRHQRESDRAESLSSSATMDIMEDRQGRIFISTESGGVNEIVYDNPDALLADRLTFRHHSVGNHQLPSDVVLSLTPMGQDRTLVVGSHLLTLMDSTGHYRVLDANYFNADYRFSDARPQPLSNSRWLFALKDGAFVTSTEQMYHKAYKPRLVLTGISIQGGEDNWAIAYADTICLQPNQRSFTLHFAALDHNAPERISYAFRLLPNKQWNYIGHNRSATLLDLDPGSYRMEIRSTNADGEWMDNMRVIVIIVKPTFWEAWYGQLFIVLLIVGVLIAIARTILYIKRIKKQQRETLAKYLELMEHRDQEAEVRENQPQQDIPLAPQLSPLPTELDPMLERVMTFIEDHLSDSDVSVGDMAAAAATSRSGLQRKLKQTMGITPLDLLREARIKHACQLLTNTQKSVSEVAYACGFTDPKYFSRCFKQSTGKLPSEYRK